MNQKKAHVHTHKHQTPFGNNQGNYNQMTSDYSRTPLNNSRNITFEQDRGDGYQDYMNRSMPL
jgi:hypothetical protein